MNDLDDLAELDAMRTIATQIAPLGEDARLRVLRWAAEKYGGTSVLARDFRPKITHDASAATTLQPGTNGVRAFENAAELMATAQPQTEPEKALVVAYWFQVIQGQSDFESQAINSELKHQGHGVKNITVAFNSLMTQRPQLVIQLRKAGNSRQARKKYKLTTEGISKVNLLLTNAAGGQADA